MRSPFRGPRAPRVHQAVHIRIVPCGVTEAVYVITEPVLRDSLLGAKSARPASVRRRPANWVEANNCWRRAPSLTSPPFSSTISPFSPTTPRFFPVLTLILLFLFFSFQRPPAAATPRVGHTRMQYTRPGADRKSVV